MYFIQRSYSIYPIRLRNLGSRNAESSVQLCTALSRKEIFFLVIRWKKFLCGFRWFHSFTAQVSLYIIGRRIQEKKAEESQRGSDGYYSYKKNERRKTIQHFMAITNSSIVINSSWRNLISSLSVCQTNSNHICNGHQLKIVENLVLKKKFNFNQPFS